MHVFGQVMQGAEPGTLSLFKPPPRCTLSLTQLFSPFSFKHDFISSPLIPSEAPSSSFMTLQPYFPTKFASAPGDRIELKISYLYGRSLQVRHKRTRVWSIINQAAVMKRGERQAEAVRSLERRRKTDWVMQTWEGGGEQHLCFPLISQVSSKQKVKHWVFSKLQQSSCSEEHKGIKPPASSSLQRRCQNKQVHDSSGFLSQRSGTLWV